MLQANKEKIVAFLEQPDISYCSPGRKDTAYCGRSDGVKVYCSVYYLLFTYSNLVYLYNKENYSNITNYQLRGVINAENYLFMQSKTPADDFRCETCENGQLLLQTIKSYFIKEKQNPLVESLPAEPLNFEELGVGEHVVPLTTFCFRAFFI